MKLPKFLTNVSFQKVSLILLCSVLALVLTVLVAATAYVNHLFSMITVGGNYTDPTMDPSETGQWTEPPYTGTGPTVDPTTITIATKPHDTPVVDMSDQGIINIMLVGEDRRPGEGRQRSDSMILCCFNLNNNTLTMISFLRDSYVSIPGHKPEKMNAAYAHGGFNLLDQTMALNFGVHVNANVGVDFSGFMSIIDMLGGVDVTLTEAEANWLNTHHGYSLPSGTQRLTGDQALSYCRIRKLDWDVKRAERQRKVLTALINRYKSKSLPEMLSLASQILETGFIRTDMTSKELTNYVMQLVPMLSKMTINSQQIPAPNTFEDMNVGSLGDCKVMDLELNRQILNNILHAK